MAKRPSEKYVPGNIPDTLPGIVQFLYDELPRIAQALNEFPVGMNVSENQPGVPITTTPTEFRLFQTETPGFDLPGGGWDVALGEWTVPVNGFYQFNLVAEISPFGAGNKDYACELHFYVDDAIVFTSGNVGDDAFPLGTAIAISTFLIRESKVRATIVLEHDQFVGTSTVLSFMGIANTAQE